MARTWNGTPPRALVVENPHAELDGLLEAQGFVVHRKEGDAPDEDELIELLQATGAAALFKRSRVPVTRRVVEACPELLVVQLCCIGDDSVDKQACADHGVMVFNDPISNGRSVVELVVAHLIALSRRLYETDRACRTGAWDKTNAGRYEILGKRLGILGLGNIGRATARACEALGMEIMFYDTRTVSQELGTELGWTRADSIEELFRSVDCLTAHLSARDVKGVSNEGLLTGELLSQLGADRGPNSPRIFLNLSRGFLHSAEDLLQAVEDGAIRYAAVDVYPSEPRGKGVAWDNPYAAQPRIALTPHIGASTQEAQPRIAHRVAQTFGRFWHEGSVRDCVYSPRTRLELGGDGAGEAVLVVLHADARGTKRAVDEAIHESDASNLASSHKDLPALGVAVDIALLDRELSREQLDAMVARADALTGLTGAIRSVRQVRVGRS
jgi:D-3-phosphoglycerate dehydrogenase